MPSVLQMTRVLSERPAGQAVVGVQIRHIRIPEDVSDWLELRRRSFAEGPKRVRDWGQPDFAAEFLAKPWWRPECTWIAESKGLVGSVTLAKRDTKPILHWLMVDPARRGRGIGRLLVRTLEAAVWDAGERQIWLETHSAWEHALSLYQAMGYTRAEGAQHAAFNSVGPLAPS